ncbi:MAG: OPT/YSL family transporter, partial [Gammaproteobacteria bacterium]
MGERRSDAGTIEDDGRRELTVRALCTGMLVGALLTPTNVYSGLKIGWSFNLSITALLIAYAFWQPVTRLFGSAPWGIYESNINQTAASSAASIISGGLVAPIPAYLMISGRSLDLVPMIAWVFSVSFLGVWIAWFLRAPLLNSQNLSFPVGIATAETIRDMFGAGREALLRFWAMLFSLLVAAGIKLTDVYLWALPRFVPSAQLKQLTFGLDPSLMMLGFGALIGLRSGLSLLFGAVLAWGMTAPWLLASGRVVVENTNAETGFQPLVGWLIWPGVALMVASSMTAILRWPSNGMRTFLVNRRERRFYGPEFGFALAAILAVVLQIALFDVVWVVALLSIPLAFVLAAVAARVVGETGIAPIGAVGKISQLACAGFAPGNAVTNLMGANVAGGAAGQCADLLNDLKAGSLIGASAWK